MRRPFIHFMLLGGLLFVLQGAWSNQTDRPIIEVPQSEIDARIEGYAKQMGRTATERERELIRSQVIDDAVWLEQAWAVGLGDVDAVVHQRLLLNMRFLLGETDLSDEELLARAIELGMDRSDTVVRRRLIDRVQALVRAGVRAREVDETALLAFYEENRERWREPSQLDLTHVYLSRDKHGEATRTKAESVLSGLVAEGVAPESALQRGDPFLAGHHLRGATPNRIVSRLGPSFEAGVADAPVGEWVGPVESAFGQHLVWLNARVESRIPELEEIRTRVLDDWIEEASREALRDHVAARREVVEIRVIADPESVPTG